MISNHRNFVTGGLYMAFGLAAAAMSWGYGIGSPRAMGPGFFPFSVGLGLAVIGACVLAGSLRTATDDGAIGPWPVKVLVAILAAVVLFGLLLEPLGLLLSAALLICVAACAHPRFSIRDALLLVAILVPFTWLVFVVLLDLQFPVLPEILN